MLIASTFAALVMFAAPAAADGSAQTAAAQPAAAEAKPATKRVCESIQVSGSNLPKKKCRDVPVKPAGQVAQDAPKADAPKSE